MLEHEGGALSQRALARATGLSLGTVNKAYGRCVQDGLADAEGVTPAGMKSLEPYRVDNAIIMAAGLSSRFVPLSYEKPKGLLRVKGEVLIERQIRQLRSAGVDDITVVVGYMKEEFFYLEDLLGVKIVVNSAYRERNNNSTIKCVEGALGNTFICSSDDYFADNPFEAYVYDSYYSAVYAEGSTDEWCLRTEGRAKLITGATVGGRDSWIMLGHCYWSRAFSSKFVEILDRIYDDQLTASKLWEHIYLDHIDELPRMRMRGYGEGVIWEFDSLDNLRLFDPEFIDNVDSSILDNICRVLVCKRSDIKDLAPIKKGMTNLSFRFDVDGESYVYRHPGAGSEEIINRRAEVFSEEIAAKLGLDGSYIYEDPDQGWKISRYRDVSEPFDYHNEVHVREAMRIARTLHSCGETSDFYLDMHQDTLKQIGLLDESRWMTFPDFERLLRRIQGLDDALKADGAEPCLCHNDFSDSNFLLLGDRMELIDWEYSGMGDFASDLGVFICCSDYSYEDALHVFELYYERPLTNTELFHCVAYTAIVSFHWFVWALYKEAHGEPIDESLYYYYRYAKLFGGKAVGMRPELAG